MVQASVAVHAQLACAHNVTRPLRNRAAIRHPGHTATGCALFHSQCFATRNVHSLWSAPHAVPHPETLLTNQKVWYIIRILFRRCSIQTIHYHFITYRSICILTQEVIGVKQFLSCLHCNIPISRHSVMAHHGSTKKCKPNKAEKNIFFRPDLVRFFWIYSNAV